MSAKNKMLSRIANLLGGMPEKEIEALLLDQEVAKAEPHADMLDASEKVEDVGTQMGHNHVPTAEELKVGPTQEASGGGAEKMLREYSNPAPQRGLVIQGEELGALLGNLAAVGKAQTVAINKQGEALAAVAKAFAAFVAKADDEEDDDEDEDDVAEKARHFAEIFIEQAKSKLDDADKMATQYDTSKVLKTKKMLKAREKNLRKAADELLIKARRYVALVNDESLTETFNFVAIKSTVDILDGDFEVAKNEGSDDDKGNQEDKAGEEGNQDDEAAKSKDGVQKSLADMNSKIESALAGFGMLQTNVAGMMSAIANQPKNGSASPDVFTLSKGNADFADTIGDRIEKAAISGHFNSMREEQEARNIALKMSAVSTGMIGEHVVKDMIAKASPSVQMLFKAVA